MWSVVTVAIVGLSGESWTCNGVLVNCGHNLLMLKPDTFVNVHANSHFHSTICLWMTFDMDTI